MTMKAAAASLGTLCMQRLALHPSRWPPMPRVRVSQLIFSGLVWGSTDVTTLFRMFALCTIRIQQSQVYFNQWLDIITQILMTSYPF